MRNNYEIITHMKCDVLADFILGIFECPEACCGTCSECEYKDKKSMVEWLNQKAEDFDYELILGYKYDTKG